VKREVFNPPETAHSYLVLDWLSFTNALPYWRTTAQVPTHEAAMGWVNSSSTPSAVIKTDKATANDLYRKTVFSTEEIEELGATISE
jgi:hypothetical protein